MPFMGRDWRSPGEAWVKTESLGWQRMKIIESQLYPSCYQSNNPACSWPPRSEFGQHMANHCGQRQQHDCDSRLNPDMNSTASRASSSGTNSLSSPSRSRSSSSDSRISARGGSKSPTPSNSPEKNVHHIYPIAISSPYGQYSCCAHYKCCFTNSTHCCCCDTARAAPHKNQQQHAQIMSRSLSKESISQTNTPSDLVYPNVSNLKLRYNKSISDLRDPLDHLPSYRPKNFIANQEASASQQEQNLHKPPTSETRDNIQSSPSNNNNEQISIPSRVSTPLLMKNGYEIGDTELAGCERNREDPSPLANDEQSNERPIRQQGDNNGHHQTNCCCAIAHQNLYHFNKEPFVRTAPHCRISVRTREVAMYNTISEAFYRLDFCNAIHDIRRFNYICKLLHLLITQNLTSLSGCATKILFTMLEQVAWEVSSNKRNIHVLKNLLNELKQMIQKYYCWGRPIGSSLLWQQHFDTIERISQIVDGIELSPPKNESSQITFNNLPVEMIREILLRLNDYRDLVNSAQASPVMRSMIDGQFIWQRLCRYHFTEQQLKQATDNYNNGLCFEKSNLQRGIKYARTESADGRTSYRNPVTRKSTKAANGTATLTTRQQLEQTSSRRGNSRALQSKGTSANADKPPSSSSLSSSSSSSSSYVTKAIRIFDKEGSSVTLGLSRVKKEESSKENLKPSGKESRVPPEGAKTTTERGSGAIKDLNKTENKQNSSTSNLNRSSHEIDWEHVFHQLRKKFDLKEEYADCLLLCRHCRCLFWKSFGHPCIKNDDAPRVNYSNLRLDQPSGDRNSTVRNSRDYDDALNRRSRLTNSQQQQGTQEQGRRLSVAALSRNFDNRAQGSSSSGVPESMAPELSSSVGGDQNLQQRRLSNELLEARMREREVRLNGRRHEEQVNGSNNDNNNNNNHQSARPTAAAISRRDELVPKHVTISPQAFLKFFSL